MFDEQEKYKIREAIHKYQKQNYALNDIDADLIVSILKGESEAVEELGKDLEKWMGKYSDDIDQLKRENKAYSEFVADVQSLMNEYAPQGFRLYLSNSWRKLQDVISNWELPEFENIQEAKTTAHLWNRKIEGMVNGERMYIWPGGRTQLVKQSKIVRDNRRNQQ